MPDLDRRFTLAAGLLELADREFSPIRDRLQAADDRAAPRARPRATRGSARRTSRRSWPASTPTPAGRAPTTTPGSPGCCSSSASPRSTSSPTCSGLGRQRGHQRADGLPLPARRGTPARRRAARGLRRALPRPARQRPPRGRCCGPGWTSCAPRGVAVDRRRRLRSSLQRTNLTRAPVTRARGRERVAGATPCTSVHLSERSPLMRRTAGSTAVGPRGRDRSSPAPPSGRRAVGLQPPPPARASRRSPARPPPTATSPAPRPEGGRRPPRGGPRRRRAGVHRHRRRSSTPTAPATSG